MAYRQTQVNRLFLAAAVAQAAGAVTMFVSPEVPRVAAFVLAAVVPLTLVFSRLTVEVAEGELRFWFGLGFWWTRIPLADIASIEPVENKWWWGWGMRITPDGWLYNVSGTRAVRIVRHSGTTLRLGTDEPRELARAVERAVTYKHEGHEGHEG